MAYIYLESGAWFGLGLGVWLLLPFIMGSADLGDIKMTDFLAGVGMLALSIGALGGMVHLIVKFVNLTLMGF